MTESSFTYRFVSQLIIAVRPLVGLLSGPNFFPIISRMVIHLWTPVEKSLGRQVYEVLASRTMPDGTIIHYRPLLLSDEVIVSGSYEREGLAALEVNRGDTFIDAGAHLGFFTVSLARRIGPQGLVIAIEPDMRNYKLLRKNIKSNGLTNVLTLNMAVGSEPGKMRILQGVDPVASSFKPNRMLARRGIISSEEEGVITIDDLVRALRISRVDWIKIDVEGWELRVLQGATRTLANSNVKLVIEIWDAGAKSLLTSLGYSLKALNRDGYYFAVKKL
jgi:FkbM family methyltransferase